MGWILQEEFKDLDFINEMSVWLSRTGLVLGFNKRSVNPLLEATLAPFKRVSLSSYPGSPNETLLSNHPVETWRFFTLIVLAFLTEIELPIFFILP